MSKYKDFMLGKTVTEVHAPQVGDYVMSAVGGDGPIRKLTSTIAYVDFNITGPGSERLAPVAVKDLHPSSASAASLGIRRRADQRPFAVWMEKWSE